MKKDPAVKIQLAGNYAGIANYWKFFDGESKQLLKFKTFEEKVIEKDPNMITTWEKINEIYSHSSNIQ